MRSNMRDISSDRCGRWNSIKRWKKENSPDLNYDHVSSLRLEARQKLKEYRPISLGQASRISGVSPADISVLLIYLEHENQKK